jgi:hypothetical protein
VMNSIVDGPIEDQDVKARRIKEEIFEADRLNASSLKNPEKRCKKSFHCDIHGVTVIGTADPPLYVPNRMLTVFTRITTQYSLVVRCGESELNELLYSRHAEWVSRHATPIKHQFNRIFQRQCIWNHCYYVWVFMTNTPATYRFVICDQTTGKYVHDKEC